jgi:DNA-binding CsgD family transcriptional regulator
MMTHVNIFLFMFSLLPGVVAVVRVFQSYKKYLHRYLQSWGYHLIFVNVVILLSLINNYIFANLFPRFMSSAALWVECGYRVTASIAELGWGYTLILTCRQLLQKEVSMTFKKAYWGVSTVLVITHMAAAVITIARKDALPVLLIDVFLLLVIEGILCGTMIYLLSGARQLKESSKQKAVRVFAALYLIPISLVLVVSILHILAGVSNNVLIIFVSIYLFIIYGMSILYLKRFMEIYHGRLEVLNPNKESLEALYKKYNISKREQEVIVLVCEGKTNKQIEDQLFISLQTVKDHITRIYRKTGVRNRVQLTNLFREP